MEIDGVYYIVEVKEKVEAWKQYKDTVEEEALQVRKCQHLSILTQ